MENTIVAIFVILALVVGGIGGAVLTPSETKTVIEYQDKIVEKLVEVPVETVVEVEIEAPNQLDLAVVAFMQAVEDEEDEARENDVDILDELDYNFDEIEVSKVYDTYNISYDGDETIVEFKIKLKFDDGDDRMKETYDVTVIFEDDEDTKVIVD